MAQASGGQIRRQIERTSPRRNVVKISEPDGHINGHGYVDLDLPSKTKWSTCNVGANSPEEYGYYLAWGESGVMVGQFLQSINGTNLYDAVKLK